MGLRNLRTFARFELETHVHRVRHGQDVRKQDRRIEPVTLERLQRHLAGELRIHAELQETAGPRARGPVLGQVTPRLAHHPDGRTWRRLAQQRTQEQVVLQHARSNAISREDLGDGLLDGLGGGARVGSITNRPAHDDVIGAVVESLGDVHGALLVVHGLVFHRTDAGRHDQQALIDELAQHRCLQPGRDDAVASRFERAPRPRDDEFLDVTGEPEVVEVAAIEARQHRHGQDPDVAFRRGRGFHDRLVAVDGRKRDAPVAQLLHGRRDSGGHVEKLQVDEDFLAATHHPVEQLEVSARHEQFQSELVELHRLPELVRKPAGDVGARDIEREDQAVAIGNRFRNEWHARARGGWRLGIRCAPTDRTTGGARGSQTGRSCRRYSPRRHGLGPLLPSVASSRRAPSRCSVGISSMSSNSAENSSRTTRLALVVMRSTR